MSIDKQKLQKLLWAEAASYRADCADWKRNTEALQEFLGEKTVEEVALELLAENERLTQQLGELISALPNKVAAHG
jgi:predicted DNA binding CopG/RHH family protein